MYDVGWKAFSRALVGTRKCCRRSTMDPAPKPPSIRTHIVRCSEEREKGARGNVQRLNYGSPGRASLAPHQHLAAVPRDPAHICRGLRKTKGGGRGNVQKLNYGSPSRASLAPHAHLSAVPRDPAHICRGLRETKRGGRGNLPKFNYGFPGKSPVASQEHFLRPRGYEKVGAQKRSKRRPAPWAIWTRGT